MLSDSCFPLNPVRIQFLAVLLPPGRFPLSIANTFIVKRSILQIYLVFWSCTEGFFWRHNAAGNRICYFAFLAFWDQTLLPQFWLPVNTMWNINNRKEISFLIRCCTSLTDIFHIVTLWVSLSPVSIHYYLRRIYFKYTFAAQPASPSSRAPLMQQLIKKYNLGALCLCLEVNRWHIESVCCGFLKWSVEPQWIFWDQIFLSLCLKKQSPLKQKLLILIYTICWIE